jgi:hypothetical protein
MGKRRDKLASYQLSLKIKTNHHSSWMKMMPVSPAGSVRAYSKQFHL